MDIQHHRIIRQKGYAAILAVLVIAAVGILLATTISLIGVGGIDSSFSLSQGEQSLDFSEGCAESALLNLWASSSYTGGNITEPGGTCTVTVTSTANVYTITAGTTATNYARSVKVVATRGTSTLTISSWTEI